MGVFSREDVLARYRAGEIRPTDLAWCEGMASWAAVAEVFGPALPAATPPPLSAPPAVPAAPAAALPPKPASYLVPAILVLIFCCQIGGIVALVYSSQVDGKYSRGDYAGAQSSAETARLWVLISVVVGVVLNLGLIAVIVAGGMAGGF